MSILYNCHTDGDNWRITKFNDGEVESSYLCSTTECQCPAGSRPICRHRLMLPMFLNRGAVDTFWFLDFDRKGWVSNEPASLLSEYEPIISERSGLGSYNLEPAALTIKTMITFPNDVSAEELVEAYSNLLNKQVSSVHEGVPIVEVESLPAIKSSWRRI